MTRARKRHLRQRRAARLRPYRDAVRWKALGSRSLAEIHERFSPRFYGDAIISREEADRIGAEIKKAIGWPEPITVEVAPGVYQHTYRFEPDN